MTSDQCMALRCVCSKVFFTAKVQDRKRPVTVETEWKKSADERVRQIRPDGQADGWTVLGLHEKLKDQ